MDDNDRVVPLPFPYQDLFDKAKLNHIWRDLLRKIITFGSKLEQDINIAVLGPRGAGKTAFLNSLFTAFSTEAKVSTFLDVRESEDHVSTEIRKINIAGTRINFIDTWGFKVERNNARRFSLEEDFLVSFLRDLVGGLELGMTLDEHRERCKAATMENEAKGLQELPFHGDDNMEQALGFDDFQAGDVLSPDRQSAASPPRPQVQGRERVQIHSVLFIVDENAVETESDKKMFETAMTILQPVFQFNIVITHIDKLTQRPYSKWFDPDNNIQEQARVVMDAANVQPNSLFLVKNYSGERDRSKFLEVLILLPVRQALRSAVELLMAKERDSKNVTPQGRRPKHHF